jgi:hypothetical protein
MKAGQYKKIKYFKNLGYCADLIQILDIVCKVENIQEDSLDSIPSPSTSVKIQFIGGKVYLRE